MIWIIFSLICLVSGLWAWAFLLGYKVGKYEAVQELHTSNLEVKEALVMAKDAERRMDAVRTKYSEEMHEQN